MRALFGRFFHRDNNEVTAGRIGNDVRASEMSLFPAIRLLRQFPFLIVNVHGDFGFLDFGAKPKPVFVTFK